MNGKLSVNQLIKFILVCIVTTFSFLAQSEQVFLMKTSKGDILIETYADKAPITVKNFESYVDSGFFNGTIFHRVIDGFMIQGGGFDKDMNQKDTNDPIKNEAANGLKNLKYTIAMARTSIPDSATSQFFINVADNSFLDYPGQDGYGYCVFGKVIEGMDIVDQIAKVPTGNHPTGHQDVPKDSVIINEGSKN